MSLIEDALKRQAANAKPVRQQVVRPLAHHAPQPEPTQESAAAAPPAAVPLAEEVAAAKPAKPARPPRRKEQPPAPVQSATSERMPIIALLLAIILLVALTTLYLYKWPPSRALQRAYREVGSAAASSVEATERVQALATPTEGTSPAEATVATTATVAVAAVAEGDGDAPNQADVAQQVATAAHSAPNEMLTPVPAPPRSGTTVPPVSPPSPTPPAPSVLPVPPVPPPVVPPSPTPPAPSVPPVPPPVVPPWPLISIKGFAVGANSVVILSNGEMLGEGELSKSGIRIAKISAEGVLVQWYSQTNLLRKGESSDKPIDFRDQQ